MAVVVVLAWGGDRGATRMSTLRQRCHDRRVVAALAFFANKLSVPLAESHKMAAELYDGTQRDMCICYTCVKSRCIRRTYQDLREEDVHRLYKKVVCSVRDVQWMIY